MEPVDVRLREEILNFDVNSYITRVKKRDIFFRLLGVLAVFFVITFLFAVAIDLLIDGWSKIIDPKFYTSFPSRKPEKAGILSAWVGTVYVMA